MKGIIHWFRNDLRLHDQPVWDVLQESDWYLPVYIIDTDQFADLDLGFPGCGPARQQFLRDCLLDLNEQLLRFGSRLYVFEGKAAQIIAELEKLLNPRLIYFQKEHSSYEIKEEDQLKQNTKTEILAHDGLTLINPEDLPFKINEIPDVFTAFRKKVEKSLKIRSVENELRSNPHAPDIPAKIPSIDIQSLPLAEFKRDHRTAIPFGGGEKAALERLHFYLWESDLVQSYKESRNGLLGSDYSSKLSPYLSKGCISPRLIYSELKRYESERIQNNSTYWLFFELLWRDFFRFQMIKYKERFFYLQGINDQTENSIKRDPELFEKWRLGDTGDDFVDANMKELLYTGFMSNRGRQNAASYLCKDLGLDWRIGASWFESQLIDYDVCSNWGNWMYVAGVGHDPRKDRYFDTKKQAEVYDSDRKYREHWL